jgi:NAD(P)-dependent dehydrogenase (short-subunit alcohol dehydrogenase family)
MAARNESKAVAAITQLETEGLGDGSVHYLNCDISDLHNIKKAVQNFLRLETRLDILGVR